MYKTKHGNGTGNIEYVVWSDVFICPYCQVEYVFHHAAAESNTGEVHRYYNCPHCDARISKGQSKRVFSNVFDELTNLNINQIKQSPVLIVYKIGRQRFTKKPDAYDLDLITRVNDINIPYWVPTNRMPEGEETRRNDKYGYTHVHHFYTKRNLYTLGAVYNRLKQYDGNLRSLLLFTFEQAILGMSRISRYVPTHFSQVNQYLSGTLYIGSQVVETSIRYVIEGKIRSLTKVFNETGLFSERSKSIVSVQSTTDLRNITGSCIDYIFTDPPFGSNLMYSELNYMWEQWSKVLTNNRSEAIINSAQRKALSEYALLMRKSFSEYFRVLKPNRWITIVFHNSKSEVWNALQDAINKAGFVIAQVSVLDKKQGSFKQITSAGAVKNDLVISAYKPKQKFERRFLEMAGEGLEEEFIKMHLNHLKAQPSIERTEQMLYSKLLAYYVQAQLYS